MKEGRGILSAIMSLVLAIGLCPGLGYAKSGDRTYELELEAGLTTNGETSLSGPLDSTDRDSQAVALSGGGENATEQGASIADWGDSSAYRSETAGSLTAQEASDGYEYSINKDGESVTITKYIGQGVESSVSVPSSLDGKTVTAIGVEAFKGNGVIESVVIPATVTSIGKGAFQGCESLATFVVPDSLNSIGEASFSGCTSLKTMRNPESSSVGVVNLPANLNELKACAFEGCKAITSLHVPAAIETCWVRLNSYTEKDRKGPFYDCANLKSVQFDYVEGITKPLNNLLAGCSGITKVVAGDFVEGAVAIPSGVKEIGTGFFAECKNLTTVELPESLERINDFAFEGCGGLTTINVPDKVAFIGSNAFESCSSLATMGCSDNSEENVIRLPASLAELKTFAFNNCASITELIVPKALETSWVYSNKTTYKDTKGAFYGCNNLTTAQFEQGTTRIPGYLFAGCSGITRVLPGVYEPGAVAIPSSVTTIGRGAFAECAKLTSFTVPKSVVACETFGPSNNQMGPLEGCMALETVQFEEGATMVPSNMFRCCGAVGTMALPNSIAVVGEAAFAYCEALTSIDLPQVTTISQDAFRGCTSLNSLVLPNGLSNIGENAFDGCTALSSTVTIPASVTEIGYAAFGGCVSLRYVIVYSAASGADTDHAFVRCDEALVIDDQSKYALYANGIDSGFALGRDNNSFEHDGDFENVTNYFLDKDYLQRLYYLSGYCAADMKSIAVRMNDAKDGFSYGVSSTMGLLYEGMIAVSDLSDEVGKNASAKNYYTLGNPRRDLASGFNSKLLNAIVFYQLSQYLSNGNGANELHTSWTDLLSPGANDKTQNLDDLSTFLRKLVSVMGDGHVRLFTYGHKSADGKRDWSNAVLATGVYYDDANEVFFVKLYNLNERGKFQYLMIPADYSSVDLVDGLVGNEEADGALRGISSWNTVMSSSDFSDMDFMDLSLMSRRIALPSIEVGTPDTISSGRTTLTFGAGSGFTLTDSSGKTLRYDGVGLSGSAGIYSIRPIVGSEGSQEYMVETDLTKDVKLTNASANTNIDYRDSSNYLRLQADKIDSAELSLSDGIKLHGDDYTFKASLSINGGEKVDVGGSAPMATSVSGKASSTVVVGDSGSAVSVSADKGIENATIAEFGPGGMTSKDFEAPVKEAVIEKGTVDDANNGSSQKQGIDSVTLQETAFSYNGKTQKPAVSSVRAGEKQLSESDFTVTYSNSNSKDAGSYAVEVTAKDTSNYKGSATATYTIDPAEVSVLTLSKSSYTYTGKVQNPRVKKVQAGSLTLEESDYSVVYANRNSVAAGTYTVTVVGKGNFAGSKTATYKIKQATNKATIKKTIVKKSFTAKALKRKAATVALPKVTTKFGKSNWKVYKKDERKGLSLNAKTRKVKVKKGAKAGIYTIELKASVAKTKNYKAASTKAVTVKVIVK